MIGTLVKAAKGSSYKFESYTRGITMKSVCDVCFHHCSIQPGQWGVCRARKNEEGSIICKNYGRISSLALDPIEKKPLKRFYPKSMILSVGSFGCNLRCPFCQNHEISMIRPEVGSFYLSPQELTQKALNYKKVGNIGVAFTYNEPLVGWEYVLDTAKLVQQAGMKNVVVTNGTISPVILEKILPFIDAMNIDLKGFRDEIYQKFSGNLEAVKTFIMQAASTCHIELTTLIVPGENDELYDMEEQSRWIASIDKNIPLHITRFFPQYHMLDKDATDVEQIHRLAQIARTYLNYVFVGNC